MLTPKLFIRRLTLLSSLILLNNSPVFALPLTKELANNNSKIAQLNNNQWQRVYIDPYSSIMMPGYFSSTTDGVEGVYNGVQYFAFGESLDMEASKKCTVYNCQTLLGLMINEITKEKNITLEDSSPIPVNSSQYPANAIEFVARDNNSNMRVKGRIYLIGSRLYILGVGTNNSYFDNETAIFLNSLSLI